VFLQLTAAGAREVSGLWGGQVTDNLVFMELLTAIKAQCLTGGIQVSLANKISI
jgi:hypothetical protein